jgi:hypothetical protein
MDGKSPKSTLHFLALRGEPDANEQKGQQQ